MKMGLHLGISRRQVAGDGLGPELVSNGTFDTNTTGWVNTNADIDVVSGEIRVRNQSASPTNTAQLISGFTVGRTYRASAVYRQEGTGGIAARITLFGTNSNNNNSSTPFSGSIDVVATTTTASIGLTSFGTSSTISFFDNVSVREVL